MKVNIGRKGILLSGKRKKVPNFIRKKKEEERLT